VHILVYFKPLEGELKMIYKDAETFEEYLNQHAEQMTNDELRKVLDGAPTGLQCDPVWVFWTGFWFGRESAYYSSLPVCCQQQHQTTQLG